MAGGEDNVAAPAVSQTDNMKRQEVEDEIDAISFWITPSPDLPESQVTHKRSAACITSANQKISALQESTYSKMKALPAAQQKLGRAEWVIWKRNIQIKLDQAISYYVQTTGKCAPGEENADTIVMNSNTSASSTPTVDPEVTKQLRQCKVQEYKETVRLRIKKFGEDITNLGTETIVPRAVFQELLSRATVLRKMVKPDLVALYDDLALCHPAAEVSGLVTEQNTAVKDYLTDIENFVAALYKCKLEESTFSNPGASSTPNHSFTSHGNGVSAEEIVSIIQASATASASSQSQRNKGYEYGRTPLPKFDGNPILYPAWREEMKNDVLPCKGDAQALSLLAQLTPVKKLTQWYTPDQLAGAWEYLDEQFANPVVVSEKVIKAFLDTTFMEGGSDQAKLVKLHETLRSLFQTLKVVKEESQLTDHRPMVTQAVRLLPGRYKEDFARLLQTEQAKKPSNILTPRETYDLLNTWLDTTSKMLRIYCPEQVAQTGHSSGSDDPPPGRGRGKGRGGGGGGGNDQYTNHGQFEKEKKGKDKKKSGGQSGDNKGSTRDGDDPLKSVPKVRMDVIEAQWAKWGPCPACKAPGHAYEDDTGWSASNVYSDCPVFMKQWDVDQRADFIMNQNACVRCLSRSHSGPECRRRESNWYCRVKENGQLCKGKHSNYLHGTNVKIWLKFDNQGVVGHTITDLSDSDNSDIAEINQDTMLPITSIEIRKGRHCSKLLQPLYVQGDHFKQ